MSIKRQPDPTGAMPEWATLFNDYYGPVLTPESAKRWRSELGRLDVDDPELSDAIRHHAGDVNAKDYGKPNLRDLCSWVRDLRKSARGYVSNPGDGLGRVWLDEVKSAITDAMGAHDTELAWNILGSPEIYADMDRTTSVEECERLEAWAMNKWPKTFIRPQFAPCHVDMVRELSEKMKGDV